VTRSPLGTRRLKLSGQAPRALGFGALWLVVALIATWGAVEIAIHWTSSTGGRIAVAFFLLALSATALMLASDSVEQSLAHGFKELGSRLQWLTTSFVALTVAVVLGAAATSIVTDRPGTGHVVLAFVFDVVLGAMAGALAVGLILGTSVLLGALIVGTHRALGLEVQAKRWLAQESDAPAPNTPEQAPAEDHRETAHGVAKRARRHLERGAALGAAGLLLSAACTALVTTATKNHVGGPDTPTTLETRVGWTVVLPVLVWFIGTGVIWWLFGRGHQDTSAPHPKIRHGTHASALAICMVIVVGWATAGTEQQHARRELWSDPASSPVPTVPVRDQQWSLQSPYLAQAFEPRLKLTTGEHWHPTSVTWYVGQNPRPPNADPPLCNAGKPPAGCYQIKPPPPCDGPNPGKCAPSGANNPTLYYRYFDASNDPGDAARPVGFGAWMVIEYWIFYNYDSLHTWALTQWHQADWEQVSVLLHRDGSSARPVEVAFSEHCYGARLLARQVDWDGSHPVSYVARGSHANYPRPVSEPVRQLRCSFGLTPRYLGVASLFFSPAVDGSRLEIPAAYMLRLRDHADGAVTVPMLTLVSLDSTPAVESFKGNWGLDNNLSFSPFQIGRLRSSAGPPAPENQGPWKWPFHSMFCDEHWLSHPTMPPSGTCG
jgi:MFS family permease